MIKWILGIIVFVFVALFLWTAFQSIREDGDLVGSVLSNSLLGGIGDAATRGLSLYQGESDAPLVTFEELGEFSPAQGQVNILREAENPQSDVIQEEYIILEASETNIQPISITGWSLQSMVSNAIFNIPGGVSVYQMGEVNTAGDIVLAPGEQVIVGSGVSPVGVSFRENMCTGYLGSVQDFEPRLNERCPTPREILPPTLENIKTLGDSCVDFAARFDECTYLTSDTPGFSTLSQACREHLQPKLTYTSCVLENKSDPTFIGNGGWRIFLGSTTEVWRNKYEVIRLLDENARTVDVFTY